MPNANEYGMTPAGPVPKASGGRVPLAVLGSDADREGWSLVAEDGAPSKGTLYRPHGQRPKAGVHMLHPRADFSEHQYLVPFVQAGYTVLGCESRWPNNDEAC